jgi:hypothetical protein
MNAALSNPRTARHPSQIVPPARPSRRPPPPACASAHVTPSCTQTNALAQDRLALALLLHFEQFVEGPASQWAPLLRTLPRTLEDLPISFSYVCFGDDIQPRRPSAPTHTRAPVPQEPKA